VVLTLVNGKGYPIYDMENNPFMFETTNQYLYNGFQTFGLFSISYTTVNTWLVVGYLYANVNDPVCIAD